MKNFEIPIFLTIAQDKPIQKTYLNLFNLENI